MNNIWWCLYNCKAGIALNLKRIFLKPILFIYNLYIFWGYVILNALVTSKLKNGNNYFVFRVRYKLNRIIFSKGFAYDKIKNKNKSFQKTVIREVIEEGNDIQKSDTSMMISSQIDNHALNIS